MGICWSDADSDPHGFSQSLIDDYNGYDGEHRRSGVEVSRSRTTLLNASVKTAQIIKGKSPYVMYTIQVDKSGEVLWNVHRRYSDFVMLLQELRKRIPASMLPSLPPKKLFGNLAPELIDERRRKLHGILTKMIKHPLVAQDPHFRSFLSDGKVLTGPQKSKSITPLMRVEDFELLTVVGKGSYAKVLQVRKKDTGKIYALKILQKEHLVARNVVQNALAERKILANLNHPFIVSLHYSFQTHDKLYLVVDYFNGGELFYHLRKQGRFSEDIARFFVSEVVLAVEHLHANGIIYRDLKPENILLDQDGHIRLTDFGLSKEGLAKGVLTRTFCGTPSYASPEMLTRSPYDKTVDWWCVGILLYEMLTGLPPFRHKNTRVMFDYILHADVQYPEFVSKSARDLIAGLLIRDPKKRLGHKDSKQIRTHAFFDTVDWKKVYRKQIEPPFRPEINPEVGSLDISNVAKEFKRQVAADTPTTNAALNTQLAFPDFTYDENDAHVSKYLMSGAGDNTPRFTQYQLGPSLSENKQGESLGKKHGTYNNSLNSFGGNFRSMPDSLASGNSLGHGYTFESPTTSTNDRLSPLLGDAEDN